MLDTFGNSYAIGTDGKVAPLAYPPVLGPGAKLTIDSKDRVYVLGLLSLIRISPDGKQETIVSPPTQPGIPPAGFGPTSLGGIGVDPAGNVYFTGSYLGPPGGYIFRVNDDGTFTRLYGGFPRLLSVITRSLAADSNGNVWLTSGPVSVVNASGIWTLGRQEGGDSGDGGPAQSARFNASALSLAPNGDLYVMDNNRVRRLTGLGAAKPAPAIAPGGIVNAASYTGGAIAPGELVSIFGSNFGPPGLTVNLPENNRIPSDLGSTKVLFDGDAGAITAITPTQINVIVPYWVEPGRSTSVTVQVDERVSSAVSIPVAKTSPGLSTADRSGSGQGAILNQDGSINSAANPAARGSVVSFFGTGEGRISPQPRWGELSISTPLSKPLEPVSVTIGEVQAEVTYAGSAPLLPAGVFQINARTPGTVASGSARVSLSVGEVSTPKQVTVAVR